jgi:hypothetical protein
MLSTNINATMNSTPSFLLAQQILRVVFFFHNKDIYFCFGVH